MLLNVIPEVLQVLHPLKPADGNTSPASVYVRAHNDASIPEDCIPSRRSGTVGSLHNKATVKLLGHRFGDGIGGGSWNEDVTWHAEHLIMRDFAACRKSFAGHTFSVSFHCTKRDKGIKSVHTCCTATTILSCTFSLFPLFAVLLSRQPASQSVNCSVTLAPTHPPPPSLTPLTRSLAHPPTHSVLSYPPTHPTLCFISHCFMCLQF